MLQLHKLEKKHFYAILFGLGFLLGFITGQLVNGDPFYQSLISGLWYAITVTIISVFAYEVGIKRNRR